MSPSRPRAEKSLRTFELIAIVQRTGADDPSRAIALEELVVMHRPLVEHVARRYADRGEALEDLVQVGSMGLLKAVERFDLDRGLAFSTYATPTIIGEVRRHFRDRAWSVKVPRRLQELATRMRPVRESLEQRLGRTPTVGELAEALGVSEEDVLEALESAQAFSTASLEGPVSDEGASLGDSLGAEDVELALVVDREALRPALAALDVRQRKALVLRYFGNKSQSEIAEELGTSQVQVSRLLARTLTQLRELMAEPA